MRKITKDFLSRLSDYTELTLALFLLIVVIYKIIQMMTTSVLQIGGENLEMEYYLQNAMTLAIGVEFVKMLFTHTPGTVIEVLLFAIARQMVVEHLDIVHMLVGVVAIAGLFAIRKYLFSTKDEIDRVVLRGNQTVGMANFIAKTKIPGDKKKLLRDLVAEKLQEDDKEMVIGTCIYFDDCALRINHMQGDMITRVEIIRTI